VAVTTTADIINHRTINRRLIINRRSIRIIHSRTINRLITSRRSILIIHSRTINRRIMRNRTLISCMAFR
jgi:hypothetical protein